MDIDHTCNFFSFLEKTLPSQHSAIRFCKYHSISTFQKVTSIAIGVFAGLLTKVTLSPLLGVGSAVAIGVVVGIALCWLVGQIFKRCVIASKEIAAGESARQGAAVDIGEGAAEGHAKSEA
jgi:hypothetical protein